MSKINKEKAIEHFQRLLKIKTISNREGFEEEFASFLPTLKELYPDFFAVASAELVNEYGIVVHWKGKNSGKKPVVLMAHHDVVSDEGQDWEHPAFEAEIHDGVIWGRGSIDNKCILTAMFEAMDNLARESFAPERDIYFTSSNNEEVAGETMPKIVEWFTEKGIVPEYVLDEGGAIMLELPMGIKKPHAMIALSEKGHARVLLKAHKDRIKAAGIKKSAPERIIEAISALQSDPTPATITPALEGMLKAFAPCVDAPLKQVFDNLWLFKPAVKKVMGTMDDTAAMIRSQFVLTNLDAGNEKGTLPDTASATFTIRIAPQDNFEDILSHIRKTVGKDIEIEVLKRRDAPKISDYKTDSFRYIEKTIKKVYPHVGVAPFILNAGTDGRHFANICQVYRFGAFAINNELFNSVHNANERLPLEEFLKSIDFYDEFIRGIE